MAFLILIEAVALQALDVQAQDRKADAIWSDFVEPDFPFFSSVLDARQLGEGWSANNLTPRGLVLNLGHDRWACFDTELLRMSVIWEGQGVTPVSMSQGSYHSPGRKAPEGQEKLPTIIGKPWIATGIYPGWQAGEQPSLTDPREPGPDPREVGRGPLAESEGRFKAIVLADHGVRLEYKAHGTVISEWVESAMAGGQAYVQRRFRIEKVGKPLWLMLGRPAVGTTISLLTNNVMRTVVTRESGPGGCEIIRVGISRTPIEFAVVYSQGKPSSAEQILAPSRSNGAPRLRWPARLTTEIDVSPATNAVVIDDISLPLENPWRRNVRLADIGFFSDGRAAVVTFDGDVWLVSGLAGKSSKATWARFASGFHEPLSVCIRKNSVFVFDRNGIWRLMDSDNNGEADRHELVSNAFAQTAETREFANGMRLAPDGSFIIAKGGQEGSTLGKQNGTVLRVSSDGQTATVLGWGLRQAFIGVHPESGLITASDQQGHYVPATPIHIIRDHQYYGFLAKFQPKEQYPAPIADPLVWLPHAVNASGAGQLWITDKRMGPLKDSLIHIGYSRPEIFLVRMNSRGSRTQAAAVSLSQSFEFAPLNGAINPADGQLYLAGFQIWGSTARQTSGLARVRYTGVSSPLPREVVPMDKGVLLRFDVPLDTGSTTNPDNFSVERWNYKRTANYGSPHNKLDGSPGQDWLTPSSANLGRDHRSVFIGVRDMKLTMQMRVSWTLKTQDGKSFDQSAYTTPYELIRFDPAAEGFDMVAVDLTPRTRQIASTPVTVDEGQRLAGLMGCTACHSVDGSTAGKVGPTWKGLFGSQREFKDGEPAVADDAYLHESILEPTAKIVHGYEKNDAGMPSYAGVLTEPQIQSLILYIKSLK